MIDERSVNRCKHFKSNGEQCKNNAMTGRRFCYITSHCGDAPISARAASLFQSKWRETIISLFFGILVATIVFAYQENEYRHGVLFGTLLGRKDSLKEPSIILGNARIGVTGANTNLFEDSDGSPLISLRIDDKGYLKTSVNLRNRSGTLVAEMKDNEWQVSAPQIFDRNFNDQVLEIRDPLGEIALQVVDYGDAVLVRGTLYCKSGDALVFDTDPNGQGTIHLVPPENRPPVPNIQPLCDYPSNLHFGDCPRKPNITRKQINSFKFYPTKGLRC